MKNKEEIKSIIKEILEEIPKEKEKKKLEEKVKEWHENLILFPGNKQEFEEAYGFEIEIYLKEYKDKGMEIEHSLWNFEGYEKFIDAGIIGLIHYIPNFVLHGNTGYGLPIVKKKE